MLHNPWIKPSTRGFGVFTHTPCSVTTLSVRTVQHPRKEPGPARPASPGRPPRCFLSLCIRPLWTVPVKGLTPRVARCGWLPTEQSVQGPPLLWTESGLHCFWGPSNIPSEGRTSLCASPHPWAAPGVVAALVHGEYAAGNTRPHLGVGSAPTSLEHAHTREWNCWATWSFYVFIV